jgi:hypothetical protein
MQPAQSYGWVSFVDNFQYHCLDEVTGPRRCGFYKGLFEICRDFGVVFIFVFFNFDTLSNKKRRTAAWRHVCIIYDYCRNHAVVCKEHC